MKKNNLYLGLFFFLFSLILFSQETNFLNKSKKFFEEKRMKIGDIEVKAEIKGTPTAYDVYYIYAPFNGRIDEIMVELFEKVDKKTLLAKMVNQDMAALLDTANAADPESKKEILKRWKGTFEYYNIFPDEDGVVTEIYVKPKQYVSVGEKLFSIARKMQIIAVNSEPIYSELKAGMRAKMSYVKNDDISVDLVLKSFVPLKGKENYYRIWLDVEELKDKIIVGELFKGTLYLGKSTQTKLIPRSDVIFYNNKKYVMMEIKPGLISENEVEVLSPTLNYLKLDLKEEVKDGKSK